MWLINNSVHYNLVTGSESDFECHFEKTLREKSRVGYYVYHRLPWT